MKKIIISTILSMVMLSAANAQYETERTGYDGDFFSLEGALELFKQAHSLRDFERKINSKNNYVNNLDLDYDGRTDYVRVEHRRQGDFHAIVLQVPLNRRDVQDVAVIEMEKVGRRDVVLQIIGDPDLYGEEVILEPYESTRYTSGARDAQASFASNNYVNVYYWPVVQDMFAPRYTVYSSPYRWSYYPAWWSPWRPYTWNVFYPRLRPYYRHCHVVTIYRSPRAHGFYHPHRSYSHHIAQRTAKIRTERGRSYRQVAINRNYGQDSYGAGPRKLAPSQGINRANQTEKRAYSNTRVSPQIQKEKSSVRQKENATITRPGTRSSANTNKQVPESPKVSPRTNGQQTYRTPNASRQPSNAAAKERSGTYRQQPTRSASPQPRVAPQSSSSQKSSVQRSAPRVSKSTQSVKTQSRGSAPTQKKTAPTRRSKS